MYNNATIRLKRCFIFNGAQALTPPTRISDIPCKNSPVTVTRVPPISAPI